MTEYVRKAQEMALHLIFSEMSGAGDTDNAMRRVARKCGISYGALWSLRYRAPRDVFASVYFAIHARYEATRAQQQRNLDHEISIAEAAGRSDATLVRAASRLARFKDSGSK